MTSTIVTALISIFGAVVAAAASYWFTKQREREAEWRKEKLVHYKAFVESLSGIIEGESTSEGLRSFAKACNNLLLFAPQSVSEALDQFKSEIRISNKNKSQEKHDRLLAVLLIEIRKDLKIRPADDPSSFKALLWASGVKSDAAP
jgi:hypothetical protein